MKGNTFQELREREQYLRREIIVDATEMLFSHKAFHQINMKDIADEANVSVASIYRYFESQDDLLLAVLLKHINNVDKLIENLPEVLRLLSPSQNIRKLAATKASKRPRRPTTKPKAKKRLGR